MHTPTIKHDIQLEANVLGALMQYPAVLAKVFPTLAPDLFHLPKHQAIARAIIELYRSNKPADISTVSVNLRGKQSEVTAYEVSSITDNASNPHAVETHLYMLCEMAIRREAEVFGYQVVQKANSRDTDALDLPREMEAKARAIQEGYFQTSTTRTIGQLHQQNLNELAEIKKTGKKPGIAIGYRDLQRAFGGWKAGDLIILAARPAMGKTSLAMQLALQASELGYPTAFLSLEMGNRQVISRWQSIASGIDGFRILNGELMQDELTELQKACDNFNTLPLYIEELSAPTIHQVKAKARILKVKYGLKFLVIDYLQLMVGDDKKSYNREAEISYISRSLKGLAKELGLPIIALSQLNRDAAKTGEPPKLHDLRESGAIEQDADAVIFIHRASYYGKPFINDTIPSEGKAELIIAKNRNGPLLNSLVDWQASTTSFNDLK